MWHASLSVWAKDGSRRLNLPSVAEREGVRLLAGVGGVAEWWIWTPARIGHLRVGLTAAEFSQVSPACVIADAGDSGPQRPRTVL